nr:HIT domain-containing protein [Thioalkalivibrio nitratireducens]
MNGSAGFALDARLQRDSIAVGELALCRLLLMRNADYPWFVLVPRRADVTELHHLPIAQAVQLLEESRALSAAMAAAFVPRCLNVAKLGNVVEQLHLHHVARVPEDPAWPGPIWGRAAARLHDPRSADAVITRLLGHLTLPLC